MAERRDESSYGLEDLRAVHERRLAERNEALERWTKLDRRVADGRLAVVCAGIVLAVLVYRGWGASAWWLTLPGAVFVALVFSHEPIRRAGDRARRAVQFYSRGLARLDGRWAGMGVTGLDYLDLEHPYAADLDIFGVGSLFERLCTARTRAGEETLAKWLLAPASPVAIHERHTAISELRPRLDLREDLELLGVEVRAGIDPAALAAWGTGQRVFPGPAVPVAATILGALGTAALVGWFFFDTGLLPLLLVLTVEGTFARAFSARVRNVLTAVDRRTHDLVLLSELLRRLEGERFEAPLLSRLVASLETDGLAASVQIRRLARLLHLLDYKRNQLFMPLAAVWLWTTQLAVRIDAWRSGSGQRIAGWLSAIGEFETLCALAAYAAENPADPFAELVIGPACYEAESVGHPLIQAENCVRNDVVLGGETRVLIVSGSNMSGKSTLLRTVGISAVLALAGAPVRARRLRITPLAVGATLRIQDSLQAGRSRFYAEITRVRQMVDLARAPLPLLFLFDELFHGTNSHDRCVGAGSVVRGLIEQGAIGLVTTHDLALAQIADNLAPKATNVHFEDRLVDGKMTFDYRMRPGVVQHSNALALMRAIGLEV
ncbi:MAG: DNA mismatch repair protein MutS [Isosphaerales bacterium]